MLSVVGSVSPAYVAVVGPAPAVVRIVSLVVRVVIGRLPSLVDVAEDVLPVFSDQIQFAFNSLIVLHEQPLHNILTLTDELQQEHEQYYIDNKSHQRGVPDPHQSERRDVEEE